MFGDEMFGEMSRKRSHDKDWIKNKVRKQLDKETSEVSEYLKDIFSEICDDFHIKCHDSSKYLRFEENISLTINLIKKSPEFKKPDGTDDWSKFKQSTFKADEVIEQILTSKSYIESVDGEISKVCLHIEKPNDGVTMSFEDFLNRYSQLGNLVQINIEYII
jgi:hypothetical protein